MGKEGDIGTFPGFPGVPATGLATVISDVMEIALTEISELYDRHAHAIDRAVTSIPGMPVFDDRRSLDAIRRDYMIMLTGALLACGVPVGDAKHLAVDLAMIASSRMRENLNREPGHG